MTERKCAIPSCAAMLAVGFQFCSVHDEMYRESLEYMRAMAMVSVSNWAARDAALMDYVNRIEKEGSDE